MVWLTSIAFLVGFLGAVSSQSVAVTAVPSVFSSPNLASGFLQCLTFGIGNSPAFPTQEQQDLDAIAQVILNAVSSNTGATASARAQALSTALASSLTDLLIAESAESNYSNQLSELTGILSDCFIQTTGSDNPAFVSRIQSLISVLSRNADTPNIIFLSRSTSVSEEGSGGLDSIHRSTVRKSELLAGKCILIRTSILCFPCRPQALLQLNLLGPKFPPATRQRSLSIRIHRRLILSVIAMLRPRAFGTLAMQFTLTPPLPMPSRIDSIRRILCSCAITASRVKKSLSAAFSRSGVAECQPSAARSGAQSYSTHHQHIHLRKSSRQPVRSSAAAQRQGALHSTQGILCFPAPQAHFFSSAFSIGQFLSDLGKVGYQIGFSTLAILSGIGQCSRPRVMPLSQAVSSVGFPCLSSFANALSDSSNIVAVPLQCAIQHQSQAAARHQSMRRRRSASQRLPDFSAQSSSTTTTTPHPESQAASSPQAALPRKPSASFHRTKHPLHSLEPKALYPVPSPRPIPYQLSATRRWSQFQRRSLALHLANAPISDRSIPSRPLALRNQHSKGQAAASHLVAAASQRAARVARRCSSSSYTKPHSTSRKSSRQASSARQRCRASTVPLHSHNILASCSLKRISPVPSPRPKFHISSRHVGYQLGFNVANTLGSLASSFANALQHPQSFGILCKLRNQHPRVKQLPRQSSSGRSRSARPQSAARSGAQSIFHHHQTSHSGSQPHSQSGKHSAAAQAVPIHSHKHPLLPCSIKRFSKCISSGPSPLSSRQSLGNALSQAVSSVGVGASSSAYANAVYNAGGQLLAGQGVVNDGTAGSLAPSFAKDPLESAARRILCRRNQHPRVKQLPRHSVERRRRVPARVMPDNVLRALPPPPPHPTSGRQAQASQQDTMPASKWGPLHSHKLICFTCSLRAYQVAFSSANSSQLSGN
ncbi:hypothetical protein HNY73_023239 [Argiope bruennichi]|uniref:Uncharacterized protein n=1 Tax=Argiope bruennichi TaxID=94029 RepID=A0A8T0E366_ARGBR|nr:hypothetical protein HNY73_023239 [Argiope bruennichi]